MMEHPITEAGGRHRKTLSYGQPPDLNLPGRCLLERFSLQSPNEVACFEQTLEKLAQNSDSADLPLLRLILDDACEQPEVMFSLVHFLECLMFWSRCKPLLKSCLNWPIGHHS